MHVVLVYVTTLHSRINLIRKQTGFFQGEPSESESVNNKFGAKSPRTDSLCVYIYNQTCFKCGRVF